jgi:transcriptional regulator GlxA family with amidase domain
LIEIPSLSRGRQVLALLSILLELTHERPATVLSTSMIRPMCQIEHQRRINKICLHLERDSSEKIHWDELSRLIHMGRSSLCRFFRRATGRTMTQYLNEIRVDTAARLLVDTDLSVLDIAFRAGFGNYSNFSRQFRKIKGCGPRELRREFSP